MLDEKPYIMSDQYLIYTSSLPNCLDANNACFEHKYIRVVP